MNKSLIIHVSALSNWNLMKRKYSGPFGDRCYCCLCDEGLRGVWGVVREDILFLKNKKVYRTKKKAYTYTHVCTCMYDSTDVTLVWIFHY